MSMTAEEKLTKIKEILDLDGSADACDNLSGAIIDIYRKDGQGLSDDVCKKTLNRVLLQIAAIEDLLDKVI